MLKKYVRFIYYFPSEARITRKNWFSKYRHVFFFALIVAFGIFVMCFGRFLPKVGRAIPENYWIGGFFLSLLFGAALLTNLTPFFKYAKDVKKKIQELQKDPHLDDDVAEFEKAKKYSNGLVRLGEQTLFGCHGDGPVRIQDLEEVWYEVFMTVSLWGRTSDGTIHQLARIRDKDCPTRFYDQCYEEAIQALIAKNPAIQNGGRKKLNLQKEWEAVE